MRKTVLAVAVLLSPLGAGMALADEDDCGTTMSEWQPREAVVATAEGFGWQVRRVKVDDGCYEVKGRDADGNDVEATLDPGTLALVRLEVEFRPGADPSRYVTGARATAPASAPQTTTPANRLFNKDARPSAVIE
ncbi:hypothetical protein GGE65_006319 [Skermanella aerolata]|nr:PepSY domain-containing protein [Skermanella aerolata]KJB89998.1 hypothetical protein N826_39240 [Skermanella aerolata KACC 11604]